jgi:hypothetical protein
VSLSSRISVDTSGISTKKGAVKKIKDLDKNAKTCLKNYQYDDAVAYYEAAEIIAQEWNLKKESEEIIHKKIDANTKELQYNQVRVLNEAKKAETAGNLKIAMQKYNAAAHISSTLFKLGISAEDKKMKEYMKRAEQIRRQITGQ